ncbi:MULTISPECIES: GtrA family protein [Amycolatopsis]|uniref:GtrA/DPMS transmembrane domain-containing protein n=2 Tax=Amycolatopsis TaxID=1813 RepID=A0ABP9QFQ6_9PSEU|nr:GtrA family protein [Amycolatopsis sacchari]SFK78864.1 Putative flippase GtrA (transmembrane translocase of bactoprenol-linked glucose) [Amycolatopsis sacchari]
MPDGPPAPPARFAALCAAIVRPLPVPVPPSLVGFALINGMTFGVDLALLTIATSVLGLPLPLGITIGYATAFGLAFVLNRTLNFRSHAPLGGQTLRYVLVVAVNYFGCILGIGAGLAALGVEYHVARVLAGAAEAVFMYCSLRWFVFSGAREGTRSKVATRGQP